MKTLAAILVELEKPLVLEEIQIPKLTFGQVLVQLVCSGICGSQLGEIDGIKGADKYLPHLLGHEGTGVVIDCGEGVTTVKEMDKVVLHWRPGAGIQSPPPVYRSNNLGTVNAGWVTTFNEKAIVSENRITVIPKNFNLRTAPLFGCAVTTAFGVINNDAQLKIGQSVIIQQGNVIGIEAVEGTDNLIIRSSKFFLNREKATLIKLTKLNQDLRADLPTIGIKTVINCKKYGLGGIAFSAQKTIFLRKDSIIDYCNKNKLFLFGV